MERKEVMRERERERERGRERELQKGTPTSNKLTSKTMPKIKTLTLRNPLFMFPI